MEREVVDKMISLYSEYHNLKLVGHEMDIPWQTVYWWLKKEGVSVRGNKSKYGGLKDQIGLIGERVFKQTFPEAEDQNVLQFQAKYDFLLKGLKIDVKTSFPRDMKSKGANVLYRWGFHTKTQRDADFIVGYCYDGDLENYELKKIFLIPNEFVKDIQTVSIPCKGRSKWYEFEITHEELVEFINSF